MIDDGDREELPCVWCGKKFEWDPSMYRFCDECIAKLEKVEAIARDLSGKQMDLMVELEAVLERR